jgi:uncharacterized protein
MIKLTLSALAHARVGKQQAVDLDIESVHVGDVELRRLRGNLQFTRVTQGILVVGELEAEAQTECTRCLVPFFQPIQIELEDAIGLPGASLTPERPVRVNEEGVVDLAPLIREYVWLGLPVNPICSADCRGLCPECGGNRNTGECTCEDVASVDSRWEALRQLLDNPSGA